VAMGARASDDMRKMAFRGQAVRSMARLAVRGWRNQGDVASLTLKTTGKFGRI
jgi:hypothetical protein